MRRNGLISLLFPALLAGCSGVPSGVIKPEKMARLIADREVAESVVELEPMKFRDDDSRKLLLQSVYARHGVSAEQVDSSLMWYGRHIDRYNEVMNRAVEMLESDEEKARVAGGSAMASADAAAKVSVDGDSVDVWPLERLWRLSATSPAGIIKWNIARDRNWEPGDGYILRFKAHDARMPVAVTIAADYQRNRRVVSTRSVNGDGWQSVKLQLDSAYGASQVYGSISYEPRGHEVLTIDSIQLIRTHFKPGRSVVPREQQSMLKR